MEEFSVIPRSELRARVKAEMNLIGAHDLKYERERQILSIHNHGIFWPSFLRSFYGKR